MTPTEFLLARIAEDEERNRSADAYLRTTYVGQTRADIRARAETEAKRRIVERHTPNLALHHPDTPQDCPVCCYDRADDEAYPCPDLRDLAAVYADHPDYRDEWRP